MTKQEAIALVAMNYNLYNQTSTPEITDTVASLWAFSFKDYPREVVQDAFMKAIQKSKFLIKPADIWEFMPKDEFSPEQEWQMLKSKFSEVDKWAYARHTPCVLGLDAHGNLIKTNGVAELETLFKGLPIRSKGYVGSVAGLIDLSRKVGDDLDIYAKKDFMQFAALPENQADRYLTGQEVVAMLEQRKNLLKG